MNRSLEAIKEEKKESAMDVYDEVEDQKEEEVITSTVTSSLVTSFQETAIARLRRKQRCLNQKQVFEAIHDAKKESSKMDVDEQGDDDQKDEKQDSIDDDDEEDEIVKMSTVASSSVTSYQETAHARLRRKQRCIDKKDLKAALKYGICTPQPRRKHIVKYTYKDIVYIVNKRNKKEITCYADPVKLDKMPITSEMKALHDEAEQKVRNDLDCWTSHTVIVVDTSGSMRTSDMWGTLDRLKSVWFSVAIDFLVARLESGSATITDVVSIVAMGETPRYLCRAAPTTWTLYNQVVECYQSSMVLPKGHGFFLPSLTVAGDLLNQNSNASCAAALIFLSDGAPSDRGPKHKNLILKKVKSLAQSFGRRLTFATIGIGDRNDFSMLQDMVEVAKDYGATAAFMLPSMTTSSLGTTFTSIATSLTTSQMEMTCIDTSKQRKVRNVVRESKSKAHECLTRINYKDFVVYGVDDVKRTTYKELINANGKREVTYETVPLQDPDARFVAISKGPFGEGSERFAYRFYEIAADGKTIVGRPLVAKESRMVLETVGGLTENDARKNFVRTFIETQQIARRLAVKFNDKLREINRVHENTPLVAFLDCSIYELDDKVTGKASVLVEEKLDHSKWHKWNSNNGFVEGSKRKTQSAQGQPAMLYSTKGLNEIGRFLDRIEEGSEDEEDDQREEEKGKNVGSVKVRKVAFDESETKVTKFAFSPAQVAQAFSHFSFLHSNRKRLVCDLQGVFDKDKNLLQFSDPVIHYYNPQHTDRRRVHGRTDRGRDGITDFLDTHSCEEQGNLCQLVTRGFRSTRCDHHHTCS